MHLEIVTLGPREIEKERERKRETGRSFSALETPDRVTKPSSSSSSLTAGLKKGGLI